MSKTMPELREIAAQYAISEDGAHILKSCLDCAYALGAFDQAQAGAEQLRADRAEAQKAAS